MGSESNTGGGNSFSDRITGAIGDVLGGGRSLGLTTGARDGREAISTFRRRLSRSRFGKEKGPGTTGPDTSATLTPSAFRPGVSMINAIGLPQTTSKTLLT